MSGSRPYQRIFWIIFSHFGLGTGLNPRAWFQPRDHRRQTLCTCSDIRHGGERNSFPWHSGGVEQQNKSSTLEIASPQRLVEFSWVVGVWEGSWAFGATGGDLCIQVLPLTAEKGVGGRHLNEKYVGDLEREEGSLQRLLWKAKGRRELPSRGPTDGGKSHITADYETPLRNWNRNTQFILIDDSVKWLVTDRGLSTSEQDGVTYQKSKQRGIFLF